MSNKVNGLPRADGLVDSNKASDGESNRKVLSGIKDPDLRRFVAEHFASETAPEPPYGYLYSYNGNPALVGIPLGHGKFAVIDYADIPLVSEFQWSLLGKTKLRRVAYAKRTVVDFSGKQTTAYMHRVIMGAGQKQEVDHINRNGLDNRRENLRLCSRAENSRNRATDRDKASSRFKGVSYSPRNKKYVAMICHEGKNSHLGTYASETDAASAYDRAAALLFGQFARLNFPRPNFGKREALGGAAI